MSMKIAIAGGSGTLGRHVTSALADRGHEVRVLSREFPVGLVSGDGLGRALNGCSVVVDASNGTSSRRAAQVLVDGSRRLLLAGQSAGVGHHVCVSIVGCERFSMGYYGVKTEQERIVETGPVPWTIVKATQFHELAAAALAAASRWRVPPVPQMRPQTVAAAEVGRAVADVAEAQPRHCRLLVAGPELTSARDLARSWRSVTGRAAVMVPVPVLGTLGRELRTGGLTTDHPDVRGTQTFAAWLADPQAG